MLSKHRCMRVLSPTSLWATYQQRQSPTVTKNLNDEQKSNQNEIHWQVGDTDNRGPWTSAREEIPSRRQGGLYQGSEICPPMKSLLLIRIKRLAKGSDVLQNNILNLFFSVCLASFPVDLKKKIPILLVSRLSLFKKRGILMIDQSSDTGKDRLQD